MEKLTWKNIQEHGIELWEAKKNEFIKAVTKDSDFSWILDGDKKLLCKKVKEKASINYGIPTQITGNSQIARCFLCLFNPSVIDCLRYFSSLVAVEISYEIMVKRPEMLFFFCP